MQRLGALSRDPQERRAGVPRGHGRDADRGGASAASSRSTGSTSRSATRARRSTWRWSRPRARPARTCASARASSTCAGPAGARPACACASRAVASTTIDCALVIGADGRGSTTAAKVGAARPYRGSRNGRGLAFVYADDPQVGTVWRNRVIQLRARDTHTLVFPCPDDRMLVLFMGPAEEIPLFRKDPQGMWDRMLAENPIAAERVGDAPEPDEDAQHRQRVGVLPALERPGVGARRRRRALQGPGDRPGDARRDALRPAARARPSRPSSATRARSTAPALRPSAAATTSAARATTGATRSRGSRSRRRSSTRRCARSTAPSRRT